MRLHLVALGLLLLIAPAALAQYEEDGSGGGFGVKYKTYEDPEMYASGPTIVSCTAYGRNDQACRLCHPNYAPNGVTITEYVCLYVKNNADCRCKMNSTSTTCQPEGKCTYMT